MGITELGLELLALKFKLRVFFKGNAAAMVTFLLKKWSQLVEQSLPTISVYFSGSPLVS